MTHAQDAVSIPEIACFPWLPFLRALLYVHPLVQFLNTPLMSDFWVGQLCGLRQQEDDTVSVIY